MSHHRCPPDQHSAIQYHFLNLSHPLILYDFIQTTFAHVHLPHNISLTPHTSHTPSAHHTHQLPHASHAPHAPHAPHQPITLTDSLMSSLPFEFLTTFFSLLISSHRNIHRFYPHLLPQSLLLTSNILTCPHHTFISNLINASILLLPIILLFRHYKRGFHEKFHDFIIPFAFCIVWGMFIFEGKEELVKTDVVVFTIFPWLVFLGLLVSCIYG